MPSQKSSKSAEKFILPKLLIAIAILVIFGIATVMPIRLLRASHVPSGYVKTSAIIEKEKCNSADLSFIDQTNKKINLSNVKSDTGFERRSTCSFDNAGDQITIFYNPANPSQDVVIDPTSKMYYGLMWLAFDLFLIGLVIYFVHYLINTKKSDRKIVKTK
jgi:hypothetical protein